MYILVCRDVNCVDILSLPADMILHCTSLLLNAAAINRQENKVQTLCNYIILSMYMYALLLCVLIVTGMKFKVDAVRGRSVLT